MTAAKSAGAYLLDGRYIFGSQNSVLYRADLVRGRDRFFLELESGYFFDVELCFQVLEHLRFGFIHQILTFSRRRECVDI